MILSNIFLFSAWTPSRFCLSLVTLQCISTEYIIIGQRVCDQMSPRYLRLHKIQLHFFIWVMVTPLCSLKNLWRFTVIYLCLHVLLVHKKFITRKNQFHVGTQFKTSQGLSCGPRIKLRTPLSGTSLLATTLATKAPLQIPKWNTLALVPPSIPTSVTRHG